MYGPAPSNRSLAACARARRVLAPDCSMNSLTVLSTRAVLASRNGSIHSSGPSSRLFSARHSSTT
eukprot:16064185-Heterocapsa_arctica.AAC.1